MRCGASRKSSAERDGGVSTTIRSHVPGRPPADRASPSPCTPAFRRTTWRWSGRRGSRGSSRRGPGVEWACTISSKVRRMSSIIACSSPGPPGRSTAARARCPAAPGPAPGRAGARGRWSARATRRPRSAARSASAARVVVLPTPPEPQQTTIRVVRVVDQGVDVEERGACGLTRHLADALRDQRSRPARTACPGPRRRSGAAARAGAGRPLARAGPCAADSALDPHRRARRSRRPARRSRRARRSRPAWPGRCGSGAASTRPSAAAATERSGSHCGRTRLTSTAPGRRPAASSSSTVSRVSVTGSSSSSVTRCTAVAASAAAATTPSVWLWIGPVRARSAIAG